MINSKRTAGAALALLLATASSAPVTAADRATAEIELFVGQRLLHDDFDPVDDASQLGATLALSRDSWPVAVTISLMRASDDASAPTTLGGLPVTGRADTEIDELAVGVRRELGDGPWRWSYGAGVAYVDVDVASTIADAGGTIFAGEADDDALGLTLSLGAARRVGERVSVGGALRYTNVEVELAGDELEAGGIQAGLTLGYRW